MQTSDHGYFGIGQTDEGTDEAYGVRQTPDGGYVIVGGTGDEFPYSESGSSLGPSLFMNGRTLHSPM